MDPTRMDSNSHIHIHGHHFTHQSEMMTHTIKYSVFSLSGNVRCVRWWKEVNLISVRLLTLLHLSYLMPFQRHNGHDLVWLPVNQIHNNNNPLVVWCANSDVQLLICRICIVFFFRSIEINQNCKDEYTKFNFSGINLDVKFNENDLNWICISIQWIHNPWRSPSMKFHFMKEQRALYASTYVSRSPLIKISFTWHGWLTQNEEREREKKLNHIILCAWFTLQIIHSTDEPTLQLYIDQKV